MVKEKCLTLCPLQKCANRCLFRLSARLATTNILTKVVLLSEIVIKWLTVKDKQLMYEPTFKILCQNKREINQYF